MLRRYVILINFLLIILSLFLINRIYKIWKLKEYQNSSSVTKENQTVFLEPKLIDIQKFPRNAYQFIVNKDLFRPERTEWKPPDQSGGEKSASRPAPVITVYGIVISREFKHAWIQEQSKLEKIRIISEGEELSGWKVSKIEDNSISVKSGEKVVKYNLIEPGKPKPRVAPRPPAPTPPAPPLQTSTTPQPTPTPPQQLPINQQKIKK